MKKLNNLEEQLSDNDNMLSLVSISYYFIIISTKKFSSSNYNFCVNNTWITTTFM